MPALYFIAGRFLGESPRPSAWKDDSFESQSLLYVCPKCGEPWGRVSTKGADWMVVMKGCEKHVTWGGGPPGSMLLPWRHKQVPELPLEVLRREFFLWYERKGK